MITKVENSTETKTEKVQGNLLKRMTNIFFRQYVSVDITPTDIRILGVRRNKVEKWKTAPVPEGQIKDGIIVEPQNFSLILEDLFTSLKLSRKRVTCTITGLPFNYRTITMPDTGTNITHEAIERAARKEMSITEPDMFIFWKIIGRDSAKKEADYFVVAVPKVAVRPLGKTLDKAKIKLYDLEIKPLALARLASSQSVIVISLENKYVDIVIVADGIIKTMYSFPLINTIKDRKRLIGEVVSGLDKTVKSYNLDYPENQLPNETQIMVSGNLASDNEILKNLSETTVHKIVHFEAPASLPLDATIDFSAANLGMVLKKSTLNLRTTRERAAHYKDLDINLLTYILGPGIRINPGKAAAVICGILLLSLIYYAYNLRSEAIMQANSLKAENNAKNVQLLVLQKTNKDDLAAQKAGVEALQKLKLEYDAVSGAQQFINNSRVDCARDIKLVIEALPAGADFKTINISKNSVTVNGIAESSKDVLQIADWLGVDSKVAEARVVTLQPAATSVNFNLEIKKK